ncbi:MAG: M23 family metallopeptidase [Paenibacillaceae bacterium]
MNEQKKGIQVKEETPLVKEGASNTTVPSKGWRAFMSKKWAFPAIYMAAAAIILTFMWVYQDMGSNKKADNASTEVAKVETGAKDTKNQPANALPVVATPEAMKWPVTNRNEVTTGIPYYDSKATNEVKAAAMVQYGDTLTPHTGIDLVKSDNQSFDVLAALSGKVTVVEKNPLTGNQVEITHGNGMVTIYQSLSDIKVAQGAEVKQGDVIAKAGVNELEKDDGVHLHFEVRQSANGPVLDPAALIADRE